MRKLLTTILAMAAVSAMAEVKLPKIISSGMVIQRNADARIWGTADAGEQVTVTFLKKKYKNLLKLLFKFNNKNAFGFDALFAQGGILCGGLLAFVGLTALGLTKSMQSFERIDL